MITNRKEFFIQYLDQFAETGNDLLQILDDIESGEVQCFILWNLTTFWYHPTRIFLIRLMNIQNAIAQLETAQTGDEILMILEALGEDTAAPTLDPIEFW